MRPAAIMLAILLPALSGAGLAADTVETGAGIVEAVVVAVGPRDIILEKGRRIALGKAVRLRLDRFPVAPQPQGVLLRDGTRLGGTIRAWGDPLRFRSVALGEIEIPRADLAAIWRGTGSRPFDPAAAPLATEIAGPVHRGRVLWADGTSVGVRTEEGLQRIPMERIAHVLLVPAAATRAVVLRNGDIVNLPLTWQGDHAIVKYRDREIRLPLAAIQEATFAKTGGKDTP
jgi:hypothetical protein